MAEEKHHHHHHHHHLFRREEGKPTEAVTYCETAYNGEETVNYDYEKEAKKHKHHEHLAELGAVTLGAYALHEKHKAKKDPEHAQKHKIEEEIAAAVAVGAAGYAFHERHEKKETKREEEEMAHGKKHHHLSFN